jgi:hypothetical protein
LIYTISSLIHAAERGGGPTFDALFSALYSELHRLAKRQLARQDSGAGLSATTLLREAYIEMAGKDSTSIPDSARFMRQWEKARIYLHRKISTDIEVSR